MGFGTISENLCSLSFDNLSQEAKWHETGLDNADEKKMVMITMMMTRMMEMEMTMMTEVEMTMMT